MDQNYSGNHNNTELNSKISQMLTWCRGNIFRLRGIWDRTSHGGNMSYGQMCVTFILQNIIFLLETWQCVCVCVNTPCCAAYDGFPQVCSEHSLSHCHAHAHGEAFHTQRAVMSHPAGGTPGAGRGWSRAARSRSCPEWDAALLCKNRDRIIEISVSVFFNQSETCQRSERARLCVHARVHTRMNALSCSRFRNGTKILGQL